MQIGFWFSLHGFWLHDIYNVPRVCHHKIMDSVFLVCEVCLKLKSFWSIRISTNLIQSREITAGMSHVLSLIEQQIASREDLTELLLCCILASSQLLLSNGLWSHIFYVTICSTLICSIAKKAQKNEIKRRLALLDESWRKQIPLNSVLIFAGSKKGKTNLRWGRSKRHLGAEGIDAAPQRRRLALHIQSTGIHQFCVSNYWLWISSLALSRCRQLG